MVWLERAKQRALQNSVNDAGSAPLVAGVDVGGGEAEPVVYVCECTHDRRRIIAMGAWRATSGKILVDTKSGKQIGADTSGAVQFLHRTELIVQELLRAAIDRFACTTAKRIVDEGRCTTSDLPRSPSRVAQCALERSRLLPFLFTAASSSFSNPIFRSGEDCRHFNFKSYPGIAR